MAEIDITAFFYDGDHFEFSHSRAEGGQNAGPDTWRAAMAEAASTPLLTTPDELEAMRDWARSTGAWDDAERASWPPAEINALFLQMVSGDIREAFPNGTEDLTDEDWADYERRAEEGQCSGGIYRVIEEEIGEEHVYYYLGD